MPITPNLIRADIKTSLSAFGAGTPTITLAAANIKLGYAPLAASNTMLASLTATAPYMVVNPASRNKNDAEDSQIDFEVKCKVYFGLPKDTENTLEQIEVFMEGLAARLEAGTGMTGAWNKKPTVSYELDEITAGRSPAIAAYTVTLKAFGC